MLSNACKKHRVAQRGMSYESTRSDLYLLKTKFMERYEFLKASIKIRNKGPSRSSRRIDHWYR
jgi:hypothetical protein